FWRGVWFWGGAPGGGLAGWSRGDGGIRWRVAVGGWERPVCRNEGLGAAGRCRGSLGQGAGEAAQVLDEQGGLFHGGEVAALVELRPVHDVQEGPVGQPPDQQDDVVRVDRHA